MAWNKVRELYDTAGRSDTAGQSDAPRGGGRGGVTRQGRVTHKDGEKGEGTTLSSTAEQPEPG